MTDRYTYLLDNAYTAYYGAKTEWSRNYWTTVVRALLRKIRTN